MFASDSYDRDTVAIANAHVSGAIITPNERSSSAFERSRWCTASTKKRRRVALEKPRGAYRRYASRAG